MRPVIATSLNPFRRLNYQLRCFNAWRELGFDTWSVNSQTEAEILREHGVLESRQFIAKPSETGMSIFGKPLPKIRSLCVRLQDVFPDRPVMVVNSDIYPAMRHAGFVESLLRVAPAVAMTREETPMVEACSFADRSPYLGGLDGFLFSPDALREINHILGRWDVSERMCFGIPGWDYLVGAVLRQPAIGGIFVNSGVLLHEQHPTTYSNVDEFSHYIPAMTELCSVRSDDPAAAARAFCDIIFEETNANASITARVRAIHFQPVAAAAPVSERAREIAMRLRSLAPWVRWNYDILSLSILVQRTLDVGINDLDRSRNYFRAGPSLYQQFGECLLAILLHLECDSGRQPDVTTDYPLNSLHDKAVEMISTNTLTNPDLRRLEIAKLFGSELIEHRILNLRLYDFLALACLNEDERCILAEIGTFVMRLPHAA
jgi:hypothetical protein